MPEPNRPPWATPEWLAWLRGLVADNIRRCNEAGTESHEPQTMTRNDGKVQP